MVFFQSAGWSATPASTRTSALAAEQDSIYTWESARRAARRGLSAATHRGNVFLVSGLSLQIIIAVWLLCSMRQLYSQTPNWVCSGCPAECDSCVSSETCTRCRPGLYQLNGMCHHVCPDDYEPNDILMECTAQGQCPLSHLPYLSLKKEKQPI